MKIDISAVVSDYDSFDDTIAVDIQLTEKRVALLQSFFQLAYNRNIWDEQTNSEWDSWESYLSSILQIAEMGIFDMEFAIAKYVLPANTSPFNPVGNAWNNIPLNTIAVQNSGIWASLVGGSTLVSLDVGSYFCYMSSRYYFNASYGLRLYNSSASIELNDATTITSQATVASVDYMTNSAIFTLSNASNIALQLYTTGTNQGSGVAFASTNFADLVIAKLS